MSRSGCRFNTTSRAGQDMPAHLLAGARRVGRLDRLRRSRRALDGCARDALPCCSCSRRRGLAGVGPMKFGIISSVRTNRMRVAWGHRAVERKIVVGQQLDLALPEHLFGAGETVADHVVSSAVRRSAASPRSRPRHPSDTRNSAAVRQRRIGGRACRTRQHSRE